MQDPESLSPLLRSWQVKPAPCQDFACQVWQRIRHAERPTLAHRSWFFPAAAAAAVVLSIIAGSGAAFALDSLDRDERMAAAYAHSIDPLLKTHHLGHTHR